MTSTLSAGIIPFSRQNGEWNVFLIQHVRYEDYWTFPKGQIEAGESAETAARRELKEETGLEVKSLLHNTPLLEEFYWMKEGERVLKRVLFFMAEVKGKVVLQKKEIASGVWVSLSEAMNKIAHPEGKMTLKQAENLLSVVSP